MICPNCGKLMSVEMCLIARTTDPKDDDLWETRYVCRKCDHVEPVIDGSEEEE
jgi:hypothetical protein